jgi:hypothetical protein
VKLLGNSSILKKSFIALPVVLALIAVSLLMPARQVSIKGFGTLSFETTVTLSVGSEVAYASPDWLPGWSYRKSHIISAAAGAGTNYQIRIRAHYGSGTDSGEDVYLDGNCRTDFGDIRFTDDDGITLLDYWIETRVNGNYAIIWVEVADNLSTTDQTIHLYYGNATATDAGNGDATFIFFDDFLGPSLDGSKWYSVDANLTFSGSVVTIANTRSWGGVYSNNEYTLPYNFVVRAQKTTEAGNGYAGLQGWYNPLGNTTINVFDVFEISGVKSQVYQTCRHDGSEQWYVDGTWSLNTWYHYQIKGTPSEVRYYRDGTLQHTVTNTSYIPYSNDRLHVMLASSSRYDVLRVDYCFLGKYVSPEPAHGAWVSDEPDIVNAPSSKDFGTVTTSTDYWAYGGTTAPSFPLSSGECFFEVTNNSTDAVDISIRATNFTGGIQGWALGASPGPDTVTLKVGKVGDEQVDLKILTTSDQDFIPALGASSSIRWELKMETPTSFSNADQKTSTITLTATFA